MTRRRQIAVAIAFETGRSFLLAIGIVVITFFLIRMIPGDVVDVLGIEGSLTYQQQSHLRAEMGLTASWAEQFWQWLTMILSGNFGLSSRFAIPVVDMIGSALPPTIALGLTSLGIGLALGVAIPALAAIFPRSIFAALVEAITIWSITVPTFSIGIAAVVVLAVWLHLIPAIGSFWPPVVILGLDIAGSTAKMLHEDIKEIASAEFVRTARAKGLGQVRVVLLHVLPNALTVVLALTGIIFAGVLTGAITMEVVFGRPGLGTLALQAIRGRDYPLVQAIIIWLGLSVVVANLLTDVLQRMIDPKLRRS